ncbi:hypothetical protein BCL90_1006 [Pedobacter alluvionis]|uniref:Uncharacterized protein n=1 Tax=Pedobacter alluvionis TaxID=475253 RepID=A0A497YAM8_9SPHI|nr:hypothetical protein BCL90_1006 [Pedobacter alluvionis]
MMKGNKIVIDLVICTLYAPEARAVYVLKQEIMRFPRIKIAT